MRGSGMSVSKDRMQYKDWLPFKDAARKYSLGLIGRNEFIRLWKESQKKNERGSNNR